MRTHHIIYDIETAGRDLEAFSPDERDYLLKGIERYDQTEEDIRERLNFWVLTSHVVSVAMYKPEENRLLVIYLSSEDKSSKEDYDGIELYKKSFGIDRGMEEAERNLLRFFWERVQNREDTKYKLVSFNGRGFDGFFLMLRSVVLDVEATRNLLGGSRYSYNEHIDLLELLTMHGIGRRYSLDFVCKRLGIESPKGDEIDGSKVKEMFDNGEYERIAEYNVRDVLATYKVFERFRRTLGKALGI